MILLANSAIQNHEISSIREAARRFNVPRSTLQERLSGHPNRSETRANSHKLTQHEEGSLKQWVLDIRGAVSRPRAVREMANLLLAKRGSTSIQTVGEKWVYNFTRRHTELKSQFSQRYDYQRANPKVIQEWFDTVQQMITKHSILLT